MSRKDINFLTAVKATIRRYHMLEPGDTVLVGLSGGPDSVALLYSLLALRSDWSLSLVISHLNHQLRGKTADDEAAFVQRLGLELGIPCKIGLRDVKAYGAEHRLSLQESAREVRYAFFDDTAARFGADKIALGHHADDNAESILIHLLRGTGPRGLTGIPPMRDNRIIRPLIGTTKEEILHFLGGLGVKYVEDRSNTDSRYLRNRIRHELIPLLRDSYNPQVSNVINRLAEILREEEDYWEKHVEKKINTLMLEKTSNRIVLLTPLLAGLHPAVLRRVIRQTVLLLTGTLKRLGRDHVDAVARLATRRDPSGWLDLPKGIGVIRDGDRIGFTLEPPEERPRFEYRILGTGTTLIRELGYKVRLSECRADEVMQELRQCPSTTAFFGMEAVSFPLIVRSVEKGDRFTPLGMSGSQKVKDFFINHKVLRSDRIRCPILLSKERIIWVGRYRIDDSVKVTGDTKRVLKAELLPAWWHD